MFIKRNVAAQEGISIFPIHKSFIPALTMLALTNEPKMFNVIGAQEDINRKRMLTFGYRPNHPNSGNLVLFFRMSETMFCA